MISKKLANHPVQDSRVPLPVFREGATVSLPGHGLTKYVYNDANENPRPQGENPDPARRHAVVHTVVLRQGI